MRIFIKITGCPITIDIDPSDTVIYVKWAVERKMGMPGTKQRLIYAGQELKNDRRMQDYNIQDECTCYLVLNLEENEMTASVDICKPDEEEKQILWLEDKTADTI